MNTGTAVKFVQITQARYDALQNKNEGTFYVVGSNEEYKLYLGSILIAEKNKNITNVYTFKGSVNTVSDLPADASVGDVYDVVLTGMNYAWTGTKWDALGQYVDVSVLATKSEVNTGLASKQDTLVSGSNIKTINDESILGSGNITISGGSDVFVAEYGVTTYAEVLAAIEDEQKIIIKRKESGEESPDVLYYVNRYQISNDIIYLNAIGYDSSISVDIYLDSQWYYGESRFKTDGEFVKSVINYNETYFSDINSKLQFLYDNSDVIPFINDPSYGLGLILSYSYSSTSSQDKIEFTALLDSLSNTLPYRIKYTVTHNSRTEAVTWSRSSTQLQSKLVSGTSIKTINNTSLLGSGNLTISGNVDDVTVDGTSVVSNKIAAIDLSGKQDTLVSGTNIKTINNNSILGSGNVSLPTKTSELTNDSNFQNATQVDSAINSKIASVYKAKGSIAFANLPALTVTNEGFVYDVNESFTTTSDFVEGAGKTYPAGTNVVIIDTGSGVYKYDALAGLVDLSGKQDLLVSGTNIKTINNQSLLGSGNIDISNTFFVTPNQTLFEDIAEAMWANKIICVVISDSYDTTTGMYPCSAFMSGSNIILECIINYLNVYIYTIHPDDSWIPSTVPLQQKLTSGATIKTINNQSVLGSGDLTIGGNVDDVTVDGTSVVSNKIAAISLNGKQDTLVSGTNIKTINNQSILGSGNIDIQNSEFTIFELFSDDDPAVYPPSTYSEIEEAVNALYADPVHTILFVDYFRIVHVDDSQSKFEFVSAITPEYQEYAVITCDFTDTSNLVWTFDQRYLQDKLIGTQTTGQNIKTINNQSILGSGDISVSTVAAQIVRW